MTEKEKQDIVNKIMEALKDDKDPKQPDQGTEETEKAPVQDNKEVRQDNKSSSETTIPEVKKPEKKEEYVPQHIEREKNIIHVDPRMETKPEELTALKAFGLDKLKK